MSEDTKNIINNMECVYKIINGYPFYAIKTNLSYISRLFPQIRPDDSVVLICFNSSKNEVIEIVENHNNTKTESYLELTGSPLEYSYGDDSFNVSLMPMKKNWLEDEEKYLPIPRNKGIELLNIFSYEVGFDKNWTLPIFILCNPAKERTKNILVGSFYDSDWFMTFDVKISGMKSLKNIKEECPQLSKKYLHKSSYKTDILVTIAYELCGVNPKMINWKNKQSRDFTGYLKIEGNWNSLSFLPPLTAHSNKIHAEILSGSTASSLNDLWNQLLILYQYLLIIEDYHKRHLSSRYSVQPLIFPKDFYNPYLQKEDSVKERLSRLLLSDDDFEVDSSTEELLTGDANDKGFQLITFIKELSRRQNLDFTDKFWQIVTSVNSYFLMTDCVHEVFESMRQHNFKPELNSMDNTRFAKMVSKFFDEQKVSLHAGSLSLELVADMGIEKITRDYTYLLSNMNVIDMCDWKKRLNNVSTEEFMVDKYREKLKTLMQTHVSLEFLALIQSQLNCRYDISQQILKTAFESLTASTSIIDFSHFTDFKFYTFSMSAPKEFITEVKDRAPSSWMCTLSDKQKCSKQITTLHYSQIPIFPPNNYVPEELDESQKINDEMYYTTTAITNYFKYYN